MILGLNTIMLREGAETQRLTSCFAEFRRGGAEILTLSTNEIGTDNEFYYVVRRR